MCDRQQYAVHSAINSTQSSDQYAATSSDQQMPSSDVTPRVNQSQGPAAHCFISWGYINASSKTAHYEYANELARQGNDVTIVARGSGKPYWDQKNLRIIPVASCRLGEKASHLAFVAAVLRHLASESYDFVNVYSSPGVSFYPLLLFLKRTKWILHIRTSNPAPGWKGFLKNLCGRIEAGCYSYVTIIDKGIAPNLFFGKRSQGRLLELPLGVSNRTFVAAAIDRTEVIGDVPQDHLLLIYVGRMDFTRRLSVMIEAFRLVQARRRNISLLMVGDGDDRPRLAQLVDSAGLSKNVIFVGAVPYGSVPRYIAMSDVALTYIPITRMYDSQPALKALEYMQMGLPQVATSTAANRKMIRDGISGLLVGDDVSSYAAGLARLLDDDSLRRSIAAQCRDGIETHYWQNIVRRTLIPFYDNIRSGRSID